MNIKYLLYLALTLIFSVLLSGSAQAAIIAPSNDAECRVDISGPIEVNDFLALIALEKHLVVNNGESTIRSVVCLNSPGGNVTAGLAMAKFFLEKGVGTRIRQGAECYSICAIMFMMGNYTGDEVRGLSRKMHVTAQLGFHRPYLSLQEAGLYTSGDIKASYEYGVATIFDILTLANQREPWGASQLIEPDLIRRMIGTPSDEMFLITTVEEVIRWKIEVEGFIVPREIRNAQIFFACENALASKISLTTVLAGTGLITRDIFSFRQLQSYSIKQVVEGPSWDPQSEAFNVTSLRTGYVGVYCEVSVPNNTALVCGRDEFTDTHLGECGKPYGRRYFSPLVFYHPATELVALALIGDHRQDAAKLRLCQVFDVNGDVIDNDLCLQEVVLISDDVGQRVQHIVTWPSGARTLVEIDAGETGTSPVYMINGNVARAVEVSDMTECLFNSVSGNTFCLSG